MLARDAQGNAVHQFPLHDQIIRRAGELIVCNVLRGIMAVRGRSEGDDPAFQAVRDLLQILDAAVDHQQAVLRKLLREKAEGVPDILQVLEEIQMIRLDIQNHLQRGIKGQKAVGVLAGLGDKQIRAAHADISADIF